MYSVYPTVMLVMIELNKRSQINRVFLHSASTTYFSTQH